VDDTNGFGPENIFWPKDRSPSGTYRVQVKLHKGSSANYKVRVIYNDQVYFYEGRLSGKGDIETVTTFTK